MSTAELIRAQTAETILHAQLELQRFKRHEPEYLQAIAQSRECIKTSQQLLETLERVWPEWVRTYALRDHPIAALETPVGGHAKNAGRGRRQDDSDDRNA